MNKPIIKFQNLNLKLQDRLILEQFSASIYPEEFIGILGPNGCGKTSLLRTILGLIKPQSGHIQILGIPAQKGNKQIGYMPQSRGNSPYLNARSRILASLHGTRYGLPIVTSKNRALIDQVLNLVEACDYAHQPFYKLSGGEKQRILLAHALLNEPKILLLDEPLNNLDPYHQDKLVQLINHIRHIFKVTVLFTTHDIGPIAASLTRALCLSKGKAVLGNPADLLTTQYLAQLYGIPLI